MVLFYRDELSKIREGAKALDVLSKYDVKKLKKRRILFLTVGYEGGRRIAVTERAKIILEKTYEPPSEVTSTPRISVNP